MEEFLVSGFAVVAAVTKTIELGKRLYRDRESPSYETTLDRMNTLNMDLHLELRKKFQRVSELEEEVQRLETRNRT